MTVIVLGAQFELASDLHGDCLGFCRTPYCPNKEKLDKIGNCCRDTLSWYDDWQQETTDTFVQLLL